MDILFFALSLTVFLLGLALLSNKARRGQDPKYELTPNCLLTRWPLLFVTGPRSIFYFSKYWNIYTSYLAEHGYEVFTLHLPWNSLPERQQKFNEFLKNQESLGRKFHLFMDTPGFHDLEDLLRQRHSGSVLSLTEIGDEESPAPLGGGLSAFPIPKAELRLPRSSRGSLLLNLSYSLHRQMVRRKDLVSLSTLGGLPPSALANAGILLERSQTLAEMDLRES